MRKFQKRLRGWFSGGADPEIPSPESMWGSAGDNSLVFHQDPSNTYLNYVGVLNVVQYPSDYSDTDGDLVTYSLMSGYAAVGAEISNYLVSPLLGSDGTVSSFFDYGSSNNSKYLQCIGSRKTFRGFHKVSPTFTLYFLLKREADGVTHTIFDSTNGTSASRGVYVAINTSNRLVIQGVFGTAAQFVYNILSTQTITVADGWVHVMLSVNGSGATNATLRFRKSGVNYSESYSVHATNGNNDDATAEYRFGRRTTATDYFQGKIGRILCRDVASTLADFEFLYGYNPARSKRELLLPITELDADTNVYSDTLTTPITDGGLVQSWLNKITTPFGANERYMLQATGVNKPTYDAADPAINNQPNITYYGLSTATYPDINSFLAETNFVFPRSAFLTHTFVLVSKQNKINPGGYPGAGATSTYIVEVGTGYVSNPRPDGKSYLTHHMSAVNSLGTDFVAPNQGGYNVWVWHFNMAENLAIIWDGNGLKQTPNTMTVVEALGQLVRMGFTWRPNAQDWWLDGAIPHFEMLYGKPTDSWVNAKISALRTKFGIPIGTY